MPTMLTWCEECGEDMHVNGGRMCRSCSEEFCLGCIKDHEKFCNNSTKGDDDDE